MRRYNKYIIMRLLGPMFFIGGSLMGIIWLSQSLRFIDLIVNQGISFLTFLYLSAMLVPSLLSLTLPVSLFISIIYTYNKLLTENELIVMQAAGLSRMSLAKPTLILALIVVMLSYSISLYFMPRSYREFKDMQNYIRDNYVTLLLQESVFNTPVKGLTIYIREKDDKGRLKGLLVHDNRNPDKPVTMMAEHGQLIETPAGPRFQLEHGNRQEINYKTQQVSFLYFDSYAVDVSAFQKEDEQRWREPEERYLNELFDITNEPEKLKGKLLAEGHSRLTWPLYNLALALFALSIFLSSELNRRGRWQHIMFICALALAFIVGGLSLTNIVSKRPYLAGLMYLNLGIGMVIGLIMIYTKGSFKVFKRNGKKLIHEGNIT